MSIIFLIFMQLTMLRWDKIEVLSEFSYQSVLKHSEEIYFSNDYSNMEFNSTEFNDTTAIIEDLKVDEIYPDAVQISWSIIGTNVTTFLIQCCIDDVFVANATWIAVETTIEQKFTYKIRNLDACVEYKIVVTPLVDGPFESKDIFAKTTETQPGAPLILTADPCYLNDSTILALNISWQRPKVGGFCIDKYIISVDTKIHGNHHFFTKTTSNTNIMMKHLYACTSYLVMVKAVDFKGANGLSATIQSKPTPRKVSEKPKLITSQSVPPFISTTTILFNWDVLDEKNNCTIDLVITECLYSHSKGYGVELKNSQSNRTIDGMDLQKFKLIVQNLSPYTLYSCYGKIINEAGMSEASSPAYVWTKEDAPSAPQNLKLIDKSKLTFSWEPPAYMPGHLQKYRIKISWIPRYDVPDFCNVKRQYEDSNVDSDLLKYTWNGGDGFSDYIVSIDAHTKGGWSKNSTSINFQSYARGVPDRVTNLEYETKPRTDDSNILQTTLSWNLPCSLQGTLKHFEVFVFGTKNHLANHTIRDTIGVPFDYNKNMKFSIVLDELRPQYFYKFHVTATIYEVNKTGDIAVFKTKYPAGIPPAPNKADMEMIRLKPSKMPRTTTSVEVLLPLFNNTNGDIQFYAIIVSKVGFEYKRAHKRFNLDDENSWPSISTWKEAMEIDFDIPYQVTEPRWTPYPNHIVNYGSVKAVKYEIGEDVTCEDLTTDSQLYCNGPLKPDTSYQVWMRAFTNGGYSDSDYILITTDKKVSVYLIIGVILAILAVGIIAAVILTKMSRYKGVKNPYFEEEMSDLDRYRNRRQPINSNPCGHESSSTAPVRSRRRVDQLFTEQN